MHNITYAHFCVFVQCVCFVCLQILCVIAKGAFGDVLKVKNIRDNAVYAMKVANKILCCKSDI